MAGSIDRGLLGLVLANVRTPVEREGDLMAQLMSIRRGEARLRELVAKYGLAMVHRNMRGLQDYSERMMRATLRRLPAGTYRFEDVLEGERDGEFFPVRVAVTLAGDSAVVDFTGSSPQVDGPVNANLAVTTAATLYVFSLPGAGGDSIHVGDFASHSDLGPRGQHRQCAASGGDGSGQR